MHSSRQAILASSLCALAVATVGCGGGGGSSSNSSGGGGGNRPTGGAGINGISLGNCLSDENWLIQPSQTELDGQTPDGSNVHIVTYKSAAVATKKATGVKGAFPVRSVVITFIGNKSPYEPGKALPKGNRGAVNTIKKCVDSLSTG
jgi:hypothetical protein